MFNLAVPFCEKRVWGFWLQITRIIHILTEKKAPSQELVEIVKDLYTERVADVRFIIPVLGGLTQV